jgi:hypothetical protein
MENLKQTFEKNFETYTSKALMYIMGTLGIFAFGCALCGAHWHIATGTICTLIYLALRSELKKESHV